MRRLVATSRLLPLALIALSTAGPSAAHEELHERIAALDVRIQQAPTDAELRLSRADLHRRHGDRDRAVADIEAARALRPDWPEPDLILARVYAEAGWSHTAESVVTRFLAREPNRVQALELRANLLLGREAWSEACVALERLVETSASPQPDHVLAWADAASRCGSEGARRALVVLERGLAKLGDAPALHLAALDLEVRTGRYEAALERVDSMARRSRRMERYLVMRADVLAAAGRIADARATLVAAADAVRVLPLKHRSSRASRELLAEIVRRTAVLTAD